MREYQVAVLGATGAVGREMIKILEERKCPVSDLVPLSSERSAGTRLSFCGDEVTVREISDGAFSGCDIVLGAAPNDTAKKYAPKIAAAGAVFIDNSSAYRMDENVPLVIPKINPEDASRHRGIISNPNCSTIIALVAVNAINRLSPIRSMTVSTYQAVSGAGARGISELFSQICDMQKGNAPKCETFPYVIAYNLIPKIGDALENGYTSEEMKMQNEGRKILHSPSLSVSCTCVRVPVVRSHSEAITVITKEKIPAETARAAISACDGCRLLDDAENDVYPTPILSEGGDLVLVGRVREDVALKNALALWCCGDQLRRGAATNAVEIAELITRG